MIPSDVERALEGLQSVVDEMTKIVRGAGDMTLEASTIDAEDLTDDAMQRRSQERAAAMRQALADRAQAAGDYAAGARERVEKYVTATERSILDDPQTAVLNELREQRAWTRALGLLESGMTPDQVMAAAAEAEDVPVLAALRAELPGYLLARNAAVDARRVRRTVDVHLTPLLSGDLRDARTALNRFEAVMPLVEQMTVDARDVALGHRSAMEAAVGAEYARRDSEPSAEILRERRQAAADLAEMRS